MFKLNKKYTLISCDYFWQNKELLLWSKSQLAVIKGRDLTFKNFKGGNAHLQQVWIHLSTNLCVKSCVSSWTRHERQQKSFQKHHLYKPSFITTH